MLESFANAIAETSKTLKDATNENREKTLNEGTDHLIEETFDGTDHEGDDETDEMNPKWQHRLTGALHQELGGRRYYHFTKLPRSRNDFTEVFHSRSDCQKAVNQDIKLAWNTAARLMDPDSGKCIAYPAAEFYTELLENWFRPILPQLEQIAAAGGTTGYLNRLQDLITDSGEYLLGKFKDEFLDDPNYYQLYKLSYFQEQPEIEEHDYRINQDEFFWGLLETLLTDNIEYICTGVNDTILEMQEDLDGLFTTYCNFTHQVFAEYLEQIETLLYVVEARLPEMEEGEGVYEYMMRVG